MPSASSLSLFARGAVLVSTCALALLVPRIADACGAQSPELTGLVPADGATYPGNAALLFSGIEISLDAVTVTVDGEPATLVPAEFAVISDTLAARVEPAPQAGQTVAISGSFCADAELCDPGTITYTASAPDLAAPVPVFADIFFGVHDHADYHRNFGCSESTIEQTVHLHLAQEPPATGSAPVLFEVLWDSNGDGKFGSRRTVLSNEAELAVALPFDAALLGEGDPTELCFGVRMVDTADNVGGMFEVCPACFFRHDDAPIGPGLAPPEPAWTDDDAVPGSACATAAPTTGEHEPTGAPENDSENGTSTGIGTDTDDSATGGQEGPDRGCACRSGAAPDASDFGRLLLLSMGLGLAALRRRGRRVAV